MPAISPDKLLQTKIGQRLLSDWNLRWEPLASGLKNPPSELRSVGGLFRVVLNGETKYIVRACGSKGGIAKGIVRISGPEQTGNKGYGAQKIREHINQVAVDILRVEDEKDPSGVAKELKRAMVKLYDPEWHKAHQRHLKNKWTLR